MKTKLIPMSVGFLLGAAGHVLAQPMIQEQPQSVAAKPESNATFTVVAVGFPPLSYQWRRENVSLPGATNESLTLSNIQYAHSGGYQVIVYDDQLLAVTSAVAVLTIEAPFTRITTGAIVTDAAHSFGCAWGDYDGDGWLDLVVGNGLGDANALYHNNRNGTFTRVTTGTIPTTIGDSDGCVWGDYDNDGDLDLFIANWQLQSFLFRNDGNGSFTRVTSAGIVTTNANSVGCAWGDYDGDGFLDLVVANSLSENEHLYRNTGTGTFSRVLTGPVVTSGLTSSLPLWSDYDGDGRLDLFVSSAGGFADSLSALYHNDGGGVFRRVTTPLVTTGEGAGDWGDYDNDGDLDLLGVQWGGGSQSNFRIYRNDGNGLLTTLQLATFPVSEALLNGVAWGDYDNDGWLDAFVGTYAYPVETGPVQKDMLYHNNGDGSFTRVLAGDVVNLLGAGGSCTWADYDNDGFLDLFVANGGEHGPEANFLYHNDGNSNRWLSVKCVGGPSNRSGIGAKIRVQAVISGVERRQFREMTSGHGYNGSGLRAHFGLGDATHVDLVRIEWPSGTVQELRHVAVNQLLTVTEPPRLQAVSRLPGGAFQFRLMGATGVPYHVETSSDLHSWTPLMTVTNTSRTMLLNDPSSSGHRFYRAAVQ